MKTPTTLLSLLSIAATTTPATPAADWPRWRGAEGDNVSQETEWSSTGRPDPLWRVDVGRGYSSPAIAGGRVYIAGYFEDESTPREGVDRVSCLDARTGRELWSDTYPTQAFDNEHRGGALSTPTVTGDTVYVASRGGTVRAYSAESGELAWLVDLVERHGVEPGRYGFASSPYVRGGKLFLNAGRTVALDCATGETLWVSEPLDASFSTVVPMRVRTRRALAVFGGEGLVVLDASDGSEMERYVFRKGPRNVEGATPIVRGQRVIISSGYDQGIACVDFGGEDPVEVWRNRRMRTKMAGCTVWEDHLYGFDESILKCMDLDGNETWRVRGLGHGALSIAGGRLLVSTSDGELIVAAADPEGFHEESRRQVVEDGGVFWTAPVLADGRVYFRASAGELVCLDHTARGPEAAVSSASRTSGSSDAGLPSPQVLLAGYLDATGLREHRPAAMRFAGRVHNDSLGLKDSEALWETDGVRWHTRVSLPFGDMSVERFCDGERGWEKNPYRGDKLLEGEELAELIATAGFRSLVDPYAGGDAEDRRARVVPRRALRPGRRRARGGAGAERLLRRGDRAPVRPDLGGGGDGGARGLASGGRGVAAVRAYRIRGRLRRGVALEVRRGRGRAARGRALRPPGGVGAGVRAGRGRLRPGRASSIRAGLECRATPGREGPGPARGRPEPVRWRRGLNGPNRAPR